MRTKQAVKNRAKAHITRVKAGRRKRIKSRGETAVSHSRRKGRAALRRRRK